MKAFAILVSVLAVALVMTGCAPAPTAAATQVEPPSATETRPAATTAPTDEPVPSDEPAATATAEPAAEPTVELTTWTADGAIGEGEYAHQATFEGITVHWRNDAEFLYLGLQAQTGGWLAFAVAPQGNMNNANFLIGSWQDGVMTVEDQFGASYHGHTLDTELGGTDDIVTFGGNHENGLTIWEAQIPLDSGDQYDIALQPGELVTIIAALRTDAISTVPHSLRTSGQIQLD